ncbi:hypothetical protein [Sphingosinicella sp. BN140058]|uniref:hypothetical protein n=1 Tax=Sphingosinicella sp. BN140058 TaxID=1892855 RepID=UPI0013EA4E53|nr:hypothetical protein [Sphingosinicella sp. BN140058]
MHEKSVCGSQIGKVDTCHPPLPAEKEVSAGKFVCSGIAFAGDKNIAEAVSIHVASSSKRVVEFIIAQNGAARAEARQVDGRHEPVTPPDRGAK